MKKEEITFEDNQGTICKQSSHICT